MTKFQSDIEGIEVQCLDFLCRNLFLVQDMLIFVHGVYMVHYLKGYSEVDNLYNPSLAGNKNGLLLPNATTDQGIHFLSAKTKYEIL